MKISLDEKGNLKIDHSNFKNFSIHPLWLRERLNTEKYLDQNNYQRLYEPSLLDPDIKFQNYLVEDNFLKVQFTDNSKGIFSLDTLNEELISKDRLDAIVERTRLGGGELVKLFGNGSAYYAPAASAIEMAEAYIKDKKRVLPCAALCEGEFGVNGFFIGVPTVIGSNGIEKILEFQLKDSEKNELQNTLNAVKKTVKETKL